jgi:hypothetical protein
MVLNSNGRKGLIFFPLLIFLLLETSMLSAYPDKKDVLEKTTIGLGYGTYKISDARYKEVYNGGREIYTLEVLQLLHSLNHHHIGLSVGFKHFTIKGKTTITQESTALTLVPISLGFRYLLKIKHFLPWIEMGMDYYNYKESAALKTTEGNAFGYHIAGGLYFEIPRVNFIKLIIYAKHTKCLATEEKIKANLGGLEYSLGLAFGFNLY